MITRVEKENKEQETKIIKFPIHTVLENHKCP